MKMGVGLCSRLTGEHKPLVRSDAVALCRCGMDYNGLRAGSAGGLLLRSELNSSLIFGAPIYEREQGNVKRKIAQVLYLAKNDGNDFRKKKVRVAWLLNWEPGIRKLHRGEQ